MRTRLLMMTLALAVGVITTSDAQEILPFPPTPSESTAGLSMQDSTYKKRQTPQRLAKDAPNILIILMDDSGSALPTTYGGEVHTPTLDRVHNELRSIRMSGVEKAQLCRLG